MDILSNLNTNQQKAVTTTDGPLLILAGAGSGKTRVIIHRIARLIRENGVAPFRIFAVTFTNKAAGEMKKRIVDLIGPEGNSVFIKTFHAAAVYILRRHGEGIGITSNFSIYDTADQKAAIKEILNTMKLDPKKIKPAMLMSKISELKDRAEYLDGAPLENIMPKYQTFSFQEIFTEYHRLLKAHNALDFNDLLIYTVRLFRDDPAALTALQGQWKYFMIDEYQDTNYAQYLIAKYLASETQNICVVGDDDQSIYSWRGADIRNILNFEKDYPQAAVITLEENYRSTTPILAAASSVIKNNKQRKKKNLRAYKGDGEPVTWCTVNNEYGEAGFVINSIVSLKLREGHKNKDFSIFYRTNAQSRIFEDYLRRESIPYRVVGGMKFYERKEIKDILAYCRFIVNRDDLVSLLRIVNTPARGIGRTTLQRLRDLALEQNFSLWRVIEDNLLTGRVPAGLDDFRELIHTLTKKLRTMEEGAGLAEYIKVMIDMIGYKKDLSQEQTPESNARLENIDEFINSVYDYTMQDPDATLEQFLQDISLYTSEENPEEDPDEKDNVVTLMTVHNAKGLEFDIVFLTGMEENMFPHKFSIDTDEGIEEERRLCYVGITRARERVFLTSAELRRTYNDVFYHQPSRFIAEIPEELLLCKEFSEDGAGTRGRDQGRRSFSREQKRKPVEKQVKMPPASGQDNGSLFTINDSIIHPRYGRGRITRIEGRGDNLKLTILFGSTRKVFMEKYTPLEKVI